MTDINRPPVTSMTQVGELVAQGGGPWPPPSPYVWIATWWATNGDQRQIILTIRFNSSFSGGDNSLLGVDYDLDPQCPWEYLLVRKPDSTLLSRQIPRGSRTGTITAAQLHVFGLDFFTDIGSITVGTSPS